ncbi:beta-glucosidase BoGH3B-like isoform X2 [Carya illinoinensis]|uniref:Beta-glucosidase n=1 Tax=Carya illinoinensis TaxID=32201 RepID=A0A8T1NFI0_CARIL|nr:beta-glucosidase BoGH3B-like isoform X2 [Carya illinoinensis]KAG6629125.1 hypothetical protein CIPAW_14G061800 [Carya illinoinensis]KAG6678122.1 hypothetical protein I3842_14G064400 [Carya illinoinensis]
MSIAEGMDSVYRDTNAPVEVRIKDLLSRMTLKEKIGQMTQIERRIATPDAVKDFSIGSILSAGGSGPFAKAASSNWADMVDGIQKSALESRLGIPIIYAIDAVHGNNSVYGATIFPHNVGLGATRDADLNRKIGEATALEVRASGIHYTFAPCLAVCRDPRWGRCYESYSEDTEIVRKMTSIVSGLQGQPSQEHPKGYPFVAGRNNVIACAKHFVGDGGTDRGINEGDTISSYEDLERIHMAPYLDCISQGVSTVMASYSSWNGRKLHADRFLLTEILKDKLGFKVMVPLRYELFVKDMISLVESGEIPMARIDDAVERILRVKFVAGLFEFPFTDRSLLDNVGCKLHRDLAREAVRKSLVLLKNGKDPKKPFLPLDKIAKRILVVGTHADDLGYQCGGWTETWYGGSGRITIGTTILDAIKEAVGDETEVVYEQYPSADTLARRDFSYAIVAVGEKPYAETPGDDSKLVIHLNGDDIISAVADHIPTLVILVSGRPLVLEPWLLEKMDALIAAWLPGSEGGGIADVIFGDHDFKGRLPVTWFKRVEQLPLHIGVNSYDPLFPLGFGLTCNKEKSLN